MNKYALLKKYPGPYENDGDYFQMAIERGESSATLFQRAAQYKRFGWPAGDLLAVAARRIRRIERAEKMKAKP